MAEHRGGEGANTNVSSILYCKRCVHCIVDLGIPGRVQALGLGFGSPYVLGLAPLSQGVGVVLSQTTSHSP